MWKLIVITVIRLHVRQYHLLNGIYCSLKVLKLYIFVKNFELVKDVKLNRFTEKKNHKKPAGIQYLDHVDMSIIRGSVYWTIAIGVSTVHYVWVVLQQFFDGLHHIVLCCPENFLLWISCNINIMKCY